MFTDDFSETWESSEFQKKFVQNYFRKPKVSQGEVKSEQKADLLKSDLTKGTISNSVMENVKKKRKLSNNSSQDNRIINHENNEDLDKVELDSSTSDSNFMKAKKKRKRKYKNKNKVVIGEQSSLNSFHHETPKEMNDTKELQVEKREIDAIPNHSSEKKSVFKNKLYKKLQGTKFRYLNEMLYTNTGKESSLYFQENKEDFQDYHEGYQSQVSKWPINPVDIIIEELHQMNKQIIIADLGCGEAKIAEAFPKRIVYSFDLIALKDCVTACDMVNVPLPNASVDVVVFCLSLMGTNWKDYLREGHRLMKLGYRLGLFQ